VCEDPLRYEKGKEQYFYFNIQTIEITVTEVMETFRKLQNWYIIDKITGKPTLEKLKMIAKKNYSKDYVEEREIFRKSKNRNDGKWNDLSLELSAACFQNKTGRTAFNGQASRIAWDKGCHGGNKAKWAKTTEEAEDFERCLLCNRRDSQQHSLLDCQQKRIRNQRRSGIKELNGIIMEGIRTEEYRIGKILHKIHDMLTERKHWNSSGEKHMNSWRVQLWKGLWYKEARQQLMCIINDPSETEAATIRKWLLKIGKKTAEILRGLHSERGAEEKLLERNDASIDTSDPSKQENEIIDNKRMTDEDDITEPKIGTKGVFEAIASKKIKMSTEKESYKWSDFTYQDLINLDEWAKENESEKDFEEISRIALLKAEKEMEARQRRNERDTKRKEIKWQQEKKEETTKVNNTSLQRSARHQQKSNRGRWKTDEEGNIKKYFSDKGKVVNECSMSRIERAKEKMITGKKINGWFSEGLEAEMKDIDKTFNTESILKSAMKKKSSTTTDRGNEKIITTLNKTETKATTKDKTGKMSTMGKKKKQTRKILK